MAIPFSPDDQPDLTNAPPSADIQELILYRDMNHAAATNIVGMVDGVRGGDCSWGGAAVRTAIAHQRNMLEASLAALLTVEAECFHRLAGREQILSFPTLPPAKPFGRRRSADAALPAVVSPGALS